MPCHQIDEKVHKILFNFLRTYLHSELALAASLFYAWNATYVVFSFEILITWNIIWYGPLKKLSNHSSIKSVFFLIFYASFFGQWCSQYRVFVSHTVTYTFWQFWLGALLCDIAPTGFWRSKYVYVLSNCRTKIFFAFQKLVFDLPFLEEKLHYKNMLRCILYRMGTIRKIASFKGREVSSKML